MKEAPQPPTHKKNIYYNASSIDGICYSPLSINGNLVRAKNPKSKQEVAASLDAIPSRYNGAWRGPCGERRRARQKSPNPHPDVITTITIITFPHLMSVSSIYCRRMTFGVGRFMDVDWCNLAVTIVRTGYTQQG